MGDSKTIPLSDAHLGHLVSFACFAAEFLRGRDRERRAGLDADAIWQFADRQLVALSADPIFGPRLARELIQQHRAAATCGHSPEVIQGLLTACKLVLNIHGWQGNGHSWMLDEVREAVRRAEGGAR